MAAWLAWLQASAPATALRGGLWLYPAVEIIHITGFVLLVGSIAMYDMRLLGMGRALPLRALGKLLLPWPLLSLALVVPTGLLMFITQPLEFAANPAFQLKLALIAAAGLNAAAFHLGVYRRAAQWDSGQSPPLLARAHALLSLALWLLVICCGRLLAYT